MAQGGTQARVQIIDADGNVLGTETMPIVFDDERIVSALERILETNEKIHLLLALALETKGE